MVGILGWPVVGESAVRALTPAVEEVAVVGSVRNGRRGVLAVGVVMAGMLLTACSGGVSSGVATQGVQAAPPGRAAPGSGGPAATGKSSTVELAGQVAQRSVVYTATVRVRVHDVPTALARAEQLATAAGGYVANEQATLDAPGGPAPGGPAPGGSAPGDQATVSLKVPSARYVDVLRAVGALGQRLGQDQKAQDVTSQAVDLGARIQAAQAGVARLQALLSRATTVGDVVSVEGELTRRQSDLEALQAQQKQLSTQVAMATVTATLYGPAAAPQPAAKTGFWPGLVAGWHALTATARAAATVFGALLPFLVVAGVLGWPVRWVLRRRRVGHAPARP